MLCGGVDSICLTDSRHFGRALEYQLCGLFDGKRKTGVGGSGRCGGWETLQNGFALAFQTTRNIASVTSPSIHAASYNLGFVFECDAFIP
jgi:hypothetical protein